MEKTVENNFSNNIKTQANSEMSPIFARHETFHPRFGWLKKGFDKAKEDKDVFIKDDATIVLGVGKNMVRAIRYWSSAFKILRQENNPKNRGSVPTDFGINLLGDNGWDPYLENPASLWLLHWKLLTQPCYATAWYFAFNHFRQAEFTAEELLHKLVEYRESEFPSTTIVEASLKKDVNCILRMYAQQNNYRGAVEDSLDSPFVELGLIQQAGNSKYFYFDIGNKLSLPSEIVVAACLDFASLLGENARTIAVSRLLYEPRSPGLVFKLTENSICTAIENISSYFDEVAISDNAGLIQFSYTNEPGNLASQILEKYYKNAYRVKEA